jgi:hypothetical protein
MGLFTNTEKKIADALVNAFSKSKQEIQKVEDVLIDNFDKIETAIIGEVKADFDKVRQDALSANDKVNQLKADLQKAFAEAAALHQAAVDAANAAREKAEADVEKFKALAAAHAKDQATQAGQVIAQPAPVVEPTMAQQFAAAQQADTPPAQ